MNMVLFFLLVVKFCQGFLLDSSNTSSVVKQTYLTVAEYYGDKNQLHNEIVANRNQQEANRNQQDRALKLLADQLQQRLLTMEQKMTEKIESHQQSANLSDQKYKELETKYAAMKGTVQKWEQKYQELEQNNTHLFQTLSTVREQNQICLKNNTKQQNEIDNLKASGNRIENKTNDIQQELEQLKQLKSVNQLQTLTNIASKVKTFDARISLLSGNEQSRNQDFLALYNLTTAASSRIKQMEAEHNRSLLALQQAVKQTRYNFTNRLDVLANATSSINQSQNMSLRHLQQTMEENNKKGTKPKPTVKRLRVVLTGCQQKTWANYNSGSAFKFPTVVTKIGVPDLTTFTSTGKFTCPVNGTYYISAVLTTNYDNVPIDIMKNSVSMHYQYINGYSHSSSYWTPGTAIIALELNVNDTVWIKTNKLTALYYSCLTIFKL